MDRPRGARRILPFLAVLTALGVAAPRRSDATVSLASWTQHSPDDISVANIPGLLTLTGNEATASVTLPFTFTIEGVGYTTLVMSTNGWIEFGANTQGTPHPVNVCLPTATHTNPFLAAYWDDLNPFGTSIRYGVVGTAPDRTWLADYQVDVDPAVESGSADDISFQIQLHESSNQITVRYRGSGNLANGQTATIGFQGAGGAAGNAQPITCNGKVLDDNRPNEGFSVDAGRAGGLVTLGALMAFSPDDISGFTPLSGDNATAGVTLPFSVTIEGTSYSTLTIGTNGIIQFGTLAGANPTVNTALPSASFPGPTLFYFWDDLVPEGGNIRYGTVGTAPDRTFIVDFQENLSGDSGSKVNGQVQIHETSNLMNVKYRSTLSANANGQTATIGFQGAGGGSATAYPLTFNGKILDDNRPDEGWSVHPHFRAVSLHALVEFSPDDITGFTTLTGDDVIAGVTLPFSVTIDGVSYSTATVGSNGIVQLGTTTGANPTVNTALPSASFSGPTIFFYWDDLQTEGNNIRYGTVGTAPDRTFIVDYNMNLFASSGDKVNGQVHIHEGSSVINVQYRSTMSANANGQSATIGFQGAGGAAATAYPLTFNGKILDDNLPDAGWSVAPLPVCGNSLIETGEQCDLDGANGAGTSCCTAQCLFRASGQTCRASAGVCDVPETCTGSSATCPADAFASSATVCRASAGVCDVAENCTGSSAACPADAFQSSATVCRASAGVCDVAENCTGSSAACPADAFQSSATVCRASAGVCDVAENCTGSSAACPTDAFQSSATVCRASAGVCDLTENCTGSGAACPADAKSTAVCRPSADVCDVAESCDGVGNDCPADAFQSSATVCRASAGVCDVAENCTGSSAACPADAFQSSATVCRASAGVCDVAENCTGSSAACPADAFQSSATVCRASAGVCDLTENCTGSGAACPADAKSTAVCRPSAGVCDVAESCDGVGNNCPADAFQSSATVCRASADVCDVAENCTGSSAACPADALQSSTTVCRASAGVCDVAENCTGSSAACPADAFQSSATVCRASAGVCDVAENCTGSSATCPADAFQSSATVCRASAGVCDLAENCTGSSAPCPADAKSTAVCRPSAGVCDVSESCDGVGDDCPADAFQSSTVVCRASAGVCDLAENCTGSSAACPADAKSTAVCRPSAGVCDVAESCDGLNDDCPADAFQSSATVCRASAGVCDPAENCTGSSAPCPADAKSTAVCRPSAGVCDVAESCDGLNDDCPADAFQSSATVCRASAGVCDPAENCTGSSAPCPADAKSTAICRPSAGVCDVDEFCDGVNDACPADAFEPSSTVCRAAVDECDATENCTGTTAPCPADAKQPNGSACTDDGLICTTDFCDGVNDFCTHPPGNAGTICRAAAGVCDVAEECDGTSANCPADSVAPAFVVCRPSAGQCDLAENCDGVDVDCPPDAKSTALCRPATGVCDVAEFCDGVNDNCPGDSVQPAFVVCRPSAGVCDVTENCDGVNKNCPPDAFQSSATVCRASAGVCDVAENCTGTGPNCPANAFQPSSTVCRPAAGVCDAAEQCTGSTAACPADAKQPSSTVCRPQSGVCDVAETCDGSSDSCPADSVAPTSVVCRPDAGQCDFAETCDGVNKACPPDAFEPNGTPCDDTNACTGPDTCQNGQCVGTAGPGGCLDHFLCYKEKRLSTQVFGHVRLADRFEDRFFDVEARKGLCTPANKNDEGLLDPDTHLRTYLIRPSAGQPPFVKVLGLNTTNQFGPLTIDVVRRYELLVPTAKSLVAPPPPPNPLAPDYEHFKCYKMRITRGTPIFTQRTVTVSDQFISPAKVFTVVKPKRLCVPVDKNGEGIVNGSRNLLCYKAKAASPVTVPAQVFTTNQFGSEPVALTKPDELCIPSVILP